jgi:NitT/TauT family transport system ATP-binding protein
MAELVVRNLRKTFRSKRGSRTVLDGITFTIHSGDFTVLLGPSGCGKSTLLRIIAGLLSPDVSDHELTINGRDITGPGPDRNVVFQTYTSYPWLTVLENVRFGLQFTGLSKSEQYKRAAEHLRIVELEEYKDEYPRVLSGGQLQRMALARTLVADPQVILMDEPFSALDVRTRYLLQDYLLELWHRTKRTFLFVTHDITEAAYLGQRVLVMSKAPARLVNAPGYESEAEIERKIVVRAQQDAVFRTELETLEPKCPLGLIDARKRGDWVRYQPEFAVFTRMLRDSLTDDADLRLNRQPSINDSETNLPIHKGQADSRAKMRTAAQ